MVRAIFQLNEEHPIPEATPRVAGSICIIMAPHNAAQAAINQLGYQPESRINFDGYGVVSKTEGEIDGDTFRQLEHEIKLGRILLDKVPQGRLESSVEIYEDGTRSIVKTNFSYAEGVQ